MAYIQKRGTRWRAQVRIKNHPEAAKSFATEAEARQWALITEQALTNKIAGPAAITTPAPALPGSNLSEAEIVQGSVPYLIAGIYFLIKTGKVIYVGETSDLYDRLRTHTSRKDKDFDRFTVVECSKVVAHDLKMAYVRKFGLPQTH